MDGFSKAGVEFANAVRFYLPKTVYGTSLEASSAKITMKKAADRATQQMVVAGAKWLGSKQLPLAIAIATGQKQAAAAINVKFGGVNQNLVNTLKRSIAHDLSKAAYSTNAFLNVTLRQATAYARQRENSNLLKPISGLDEKVTRSLLTGAMEQKLYKQNADDLLRALNLKENDKVLFLSGRRMDAEDYSKLLVRTRTMEALNQGKATTMIENGYLYIETSEHEGVDPKDICYFLQGKVWALGPNPEGIPILPLEYGLPPWHPNCEHTFGPWQSKFQSEGAVDKVISSHEGDSDELSSWGGKTYQPAEK